MCTKSIVFIFKPLLRSKTECLIQCFAHIDFTWAGYTGILWWHIFVFITIIILFLSARENATIGDRLTIGQCPLALHVWYGCARERSTPPPHRRPPVFPIRSFICAEPPQPPAISSRATLALYLVTFRHFWRLFSITGTYWQT